MILRFFEISTKKDYILHDVKQFHLNLMFKKWCVLQMNEKYYKIRILDYYTTLLLEVRK